MASCSNSCSAPLKKVSCPLRMSDGRFTTDYRPRCQVNAEINNILGENNIPKNSYELRMYLQQNGLKIIQDQMDNAIKEHAPCAPCTNPPNPSTMLPEQYMIKCNGSSCERVLVNPNGLGDGRVFE